MTKCNFCGREESPYKGVHLIKNDGSISFFCSSKCRKNALKLGRDKKKFKWTEAYRINKEKAAALEKRINEKVEKEKKEEVKSDKK